MQRYALPLTYGHIWQKYDAIERRLSAPLSQEIIAPVRIHPGITDLELLESDIESPAGVSQSCFDVVFSRQGLMYPERLCSHLAKAGFTVEYSEAIGIDVIAVQTADELVNWARTIGLLGLLQGVAESIQRAWKQGLINAAERLRRCDGTIRLGGSTRIVVTSLA